MHKYIDQDICQPYKPYNHLQADKRLYQDLLKGVFIGKVPIMDSIATTYSKLLIEQTTSPEKLYDIIEEIIDIYGDILEETEENELRDLVSSNQISLLVARLDVIEQLYLNFRLELLKERIEKVEHIMQEVENRCQLSLIADSGIGQIREHIQSNPADILQIVREVNRQYNRALFCLGKAIYGSVFHEVINNSGNEQDTDDIWSATLVKFITNIEKSTYRWYEKKCLSKTYIMTIAKSKWIDELRRRKRRNETQLTDNTSHES